MKKTLLVSFMLFFFLGFLATNLILSEYWGSALANSIPIIPLEPSIVCIVISALLWLFDYKLENLIYNI